MIKNEILAPTIDTLAAIIITDLHRDFQQNYTSLMRTFDEFDSIESFIDSLIDELSESEFFLDIIIPASTDDSSDDAIIESLTNILTNRRDDLIALIAANFRDLLKLRDIYAANARANILARISQLNDELALLDS